jgi:hypothetical protein
LAPNDGQKLFGKSKIEWRAFATKLVYYFRDQIGFIIKDLNSMLKSTIIENLVENRILKIVTECMLSLTELVADVMLNNEAHAAIRATTKFIASTTEDEIINLISFKRLNSIMISLAKNPSLLDLIFSRSTTVNQIGIEAHTLFKGTSRTIGGEFGALVVVRGEEDKAIFGADKWGILGYMETLYLNKDVGHRIPGYSIYNSIRSFYYSNKPPNPQPEKNLLRSVYCGVGQCLLAKADSKTTMQLVLLQRDVLKWVNLGELPPRQLPAEGATLREKTKYRDFLLRKAGELEGQGRGNIATILHSIVNVQIDDGQVWDLKVHEDWIRDENWSGYSSVSKNNMVQKWSHRYVYFYTGGARCQGHLSLM